MNSELINSINIHKISKPFSIENYSLLEKEMSNNELVKSLDLEKNKIIVVLEKKDGNFEIENYNYIELSEKDKSLLLEWFSVEEHTYYIDNMFRIDLENYILLVQILTNQKNPESNVLYGLAIKNTTWNVMTLLNQRTSYITSRFI
jgi:hypothetical protein